MDYLNTLQALTRDNVLEDYAYSTIFGGTPEEHRAWRQRMAQCRARRSARIARMPKVLRMRFDRREKMRGEIRRLEREIDQLKENISHAADALEGRWSDD
jgi:hypothetical protein